MILSFDVLLVVGALVFYLYDASALLFVDELVVEVSRRRCIARVGTSALVSGKRLFLPNPLTPYRPLLPVRVEELLGSGRAHEHGQLPHFLDALRPLQVLSILLLLLFAVVLPLILWRFGTGNALLAWLVVVYALTARAVFTAWRHRRVLDLPPRALVSLAFECLACPPFAINIVRKLTLRRQGITFADLRNVAGAAGVQALTTTVAAHVVRTLDQIGLDAPQAATLTAYRDQHPMETTS